ncbi:Abi-alpha family protein [Gluconobacter morbifer]|uniref:DUF4393 domain-containing protein n=1 Tax=Gluconobacter morbifer G707 TaxID=1088869 RepID=G6XHK3_9PROT|nr:hypothetical protein [Gluconobacter morbifer]EHH69661.1 hypothetical protein GMO_09690 [Gluconobacter morbifer G707]
MLHQLFAGAVAGDVHELSKVVSPLAKMAGSAASNLLQTNVVEPLKVKWQTRQKNLDDIREKVEEKVGTHPLHEPSRKEAEPVLNAAAEEDRSELQEIWASLIANLVTGRISSVRPEVIRIIRGFVPVDALVLRTVQKSQTGDSLFPQFEIIADHVLRELPHGSVDDIQLSLDVLTDQGVLQAHEIARSSGKRECRWTVQAMGRVILRSVDPDF